MADFEGPEPGESELVFSAQNTHDPRCGRPPRLRNTDNPRLYHGYFENYYTEQFVFTYDEATKTGTVSGGDLEWGNPKAFTVPLVEEALRETQRLASMIVDDGRGARAALPIIDAALALGRLTGVTGKDEVMWLRACLEACNILRERPGGDSTT